ncbi:MAG: hypothetical protein AAF533_09220 [Acidobacteriota bacterium]
MRSHWLRLQAWHLVALALAGLLAVNRPTQPLLGTLGLLAYPMAATWIAAAWARRNRNGPRVALLATLAAAGACGLAGALRHLLTPHLIVGPFPPDMSWMVLTSLAVAAAILSTVTALVAGSTQAPSWCRHAIAPLLTALLLGLLAMSAWRLASLESSTPSLLLGDLVRLETSTLEREEASSLLAPLLAILGEERQARQLHAERWPRLPTSPPAWTPPPTVEPWREAAADIAAQHRIVLIMESHHVSEHRELVRRLLPTFAEHGFHYFAAETFQAPHDELATPGGSSLGMGFYGQDPRFGELVRDALSLDFTLISYDYGASAPEDREQQQAEKLAAVLAEDPDARLLVHVGYFHLLKHPTFDGERWMASRLWELTGIEPYTLWQLSSEPTAGQGPTDHERLTSVVGTRDEPVVLRPMPKHAISSFRDLFEADTEIVDALVLHPPLKETRLGRPTWLPASGRHRLAGTVRGGKRPLLVLARSVSGTPGVVPLDQVVLRFGDEFELWVSDERATVELHDQVGKVGPQAEWSVGGGPVELLVEGR